MSADLLQKLLRSLDRELPDVISLRERLHAAAEPSHEEPEAGFEPAPAMRSCGSDDFGFYGKTSPTLMMFVGIKDAPGTPNVPLHHPRFLPSNEAVQAVARAQAVALAAASTLDPAS